MIIARTEDEIERLVAHFEAKGYKGKKYFRKGKRMPLSYWIPQMKGHLKEYGIVAYKLHWECKDGKLDVTVYWNPEAQTAEAYLQREQYTI